MTTDTNAWHARWAFTTTTGISSDTITRATFAQVRDAVAAAAETSLAGLTDVESEEMNQLWSAFLATLELHAERKVNIYGLWQFADGRWADVEISHTPVSVPRVYKGDVMSDREWQAFMSGALGLSVSEEGLHIDIDPPQQDLASWDA